jgi:hypothetical protein
MSALLLVLAGCAGVPAHSPYAGQEDRAIKALSQKEVTDLLDGAGMGYAKAAELNRYPGPSHVLELADALELSAPQRTAIEEILRSHKAEARKLGGDVVELEQRLDALFAKESPSAETVDAAVARLAAAGGLLRASHLKAHVATTKVLAPMQIDSYMELRGYGSHQH